MLADCNLGVDFLDECQVVVGFKEQCMYIRDENSSRQHKSKRKEGINTKDRCQANTLHQIKHVIQTQ